MDQDQASFSNRPPAMAHRQTSSYNNRPSAVTTYYRASLLTKLSTYEKPSYYTTYGSL